MTRHTQDFTNGGHYATSLEGQSLPSPVWGGASASVGTVTQDFGTYNPATASMYDYAAAVGWTAGVHVGIDVGMPSGTPIYAAESGTVTEGHADGSLGQFFRPRPVQVKTQSGYLDIYGHMSRDAVQTGQTVQKGQLVGWSGEQTYPGTETPDGTGPHIHFERRDPGGMAVNPVPLLVSSPTAGGQGPAGGGFWVTPGGGPVGTPLSSIPGADTVKQAVTDAIITPIARIAGRAGVFILALLLLGAGVVFMFKDQIKSAAESALKVAAVA